MKIRKQTPKPCEKKGCDNHLASNLCEVKSACDDLGSYLLNNSKGTDAYQTPEFTGCHDIEAYLTENNLIRYETREQTGLEVLFDGIDSDEPMSDLLYDSGVDLNLFEPDNLLISLDSKLEDINNGKFYNSEEYELKEQLVPIYSRNQSSMNFFSKELSLTKSKSSEIMGLAPTNLFDSLHKSIFARGVFSSQYQDSNRARYEREKDELKADDLAAVALITLKEITEIEEIKKLWPRYTKNRYEKNRSLVYTRFNKNMPFWAKRFNEIWWSLTDAQTEAILLEFFYIEDEKPTQKENAKALGISIASYQDRLEGAFKHFDRLYPEYTRERRRNHKPKPVDNPPAPLYEIEGDEMIRIPFPIKKERKLTPMEKSEIRGWSNEKMAYIDSFKEVETHLVEIEAQDEDPE